MIKIQRWTLCAIALPCLLPGWADAGTATSTMTNTVSVTEACNVTSLGFTTTYDPVSANATANQDATATITSTCTLGAAVMITLGQGNSPAAGSTDLLPLRRLSSGGGTPNYLSYNLYQDSGRTLVWGNTAVSGLATTGAAAAGTATVYARIPAGQTAAKAGTYNDSVIVTLSF